LSLGRSFLERVVAPARMTPPEGAGSGDRPVGRKEGADRNADHVVDPLVARRLAGIEEERL
jgi:hypothetical protein